MEAPYEEPKHLKLLRRLVTTLTIVFILGLITVVSVIVIRFAAPATPPPEIPENMEIPMGETVQAVTLGKDWVAVVTRGQNGIEQIHIFNPDGTLRQTMEIK